MRQPERLDTPRSDYLPSLVTKLRGGCPASQRRIR